MKNKIIILLVLIFLSGCATSGKAFNLVTSSKYGGGYVVNRKGVIIPEYTIGKNNGAPKDLELAKKRFRRRKFVVDKYYKKMGIIIDSNVEMGSTMAGMATLPFQLPFKVIDYNRYESDPEYRKKVDEAEDLADKKEQERIDQLKKELAEWIQKDLEQEENGL